MIRPQLKRLSLFFGLPLMLIIGAVLMVALLIPPTVEPRFEASPRYVVNATVKWTYKSRWTGSGSPRLADLTGDGIADVVIGGGWEKKAGLVLAVDGHTGALLWEKKLKDEVFTTPVFLDVDLDGVPDVFVGGRSWNQDFIALSGKDGRTLWSLKKSNPSRRWPLTNFGGPLVIPDRDGDGLDDLMVIQAGGWDKSRPAAEIYQISSATGSVIEAQKSPDMKEIYSMPAIEPNPEGEGHHLYLGTGGEVVAGHLIKLEFPGMKEQWRFASQNKGFISSTLLYDFDGNGRRDAVSLDFDGELYRIDGRSGLPVWQLSRPGYETASSPALGAFNQKDGLDVVAVYSKGENLKYTEHALLVWVDGDSGEVIHERRAGVFASSSPLVLDLNHDGYDEVIVITNLKNSWRESPWDNRCALVIFDGKKDKQEILRLEFEGFSSCTPYLTDMDGNNKLDLVFSSLSGVVRVELEVGLPRPLMLQDVPLDFPRLRWNQFRGAHGTGVLEREPAAPVR